MQSVCARAGVCLRGLCLCGLCFVVVKERVTRSCCHFTYKQPSLLPKLELATATRQSQSLLNQPPLTLPAPSNNTTTVATAERA